MSLSLFRLAWSFKLNAVCNTGYQHPKAVHSASGSNIDVSAPLEPATSFSLSCFTTIVCPVFHLKLSIDEAQELSQDQSRVIHLVQGPFAPRTR